MLCYIYSMRKYVFITFMLVSGIARADLSALATLAPVNMESMKLTPVVQAPAVNPEVLKFDLYEHQKREIEEQQAREEEAKNPQPLIVIVNNQAPAPEPENPLMSVLKFGVGVASRGLLRF